MTPKRRSGKARPRLDPLLLAGGAAAMILVLLFLAGLAGRAAAAQGSALARGGLGIFRRLWLVSLFDLNAGTAVSMPRLNALDLAVMALLVVVYLGLRRTAGRTGRTWLTAAIVVELAGIALFAATGMAGRSTVMATGLVVSIVQLLGGARGRAAGAVGIPANGLVLAGDMATPISSWTLVVLFLGAGYLLLMAWYFTTGAGLLLRAAAGRAGTIGNVRRDAPRG